jgi:hypothetical protein
MTMNFRLDMQDEAGPFVLEIDNVREDNASFQKL